MKRSAAVPVLYFAMILMLVATMHPCVAQEGVRYIGNYTRDANGETGVAIMDVTFGEQEGNRRPVSGHIAFETSASGFCASGHFEGDAYQDIEDTIPGVDQGDYSLAVFTTGLLNEACVSVPANSLLINAIFSSNLDAVEGTYVLFDSNSFDNSGTFSGVVADDVDIDKNLPCPEGGAARGNPFNAATGNKYQIENDYISPLSGLSFTRYYNSQFAADVSLGYGWTSPFHQRLEISGDSLRVRRGSGRAEPFIRTATGWQGDPDTDLVLSETPEGLTLLLPDGGSEQYDPVGKLLVETAPTGQRIGYAYDDTGKLTQVTGPFGHRLAFAYDAKNHVVNFTDPAGQVFTYTYDANDNLTGVTYPDGTGRTYHYEDTRFPHHLTGVTDENGVRFASYAYDEAGRAISTEHAPTEDGTPQERYGFAYDSDVQTTVTDPLGRTEALVFETILGVKLLTRDTHSSDGLSLIQEFDAQGNVVLRTDETGRSTRYAYNPSNQRTSMTEADGTAEARTTTYEYLSAERDLPTVVRHPSVFPGGERVTEIAYENLLPVRVTVQGFTPDGTPVARSTAYTYTEHGQLAQVDGPRTDVSDLTTFAYHECATGGACGQLRQVTNALGHVTTYEAYDAHGRLTRMTDPNGRVTKGTVRFRA